MNTTIFDSDVARLWYIECAQNTHLYAVVCGRVPWLYQYWRGGFMFLVVLCPETPDGSTRSGSGFKASQKTGQRLKVSSDRTGEAGIRTCDPWLTRPKQLFVAFPWVETSTGLGGFMICVFII